MGIVDDDTWFRSPESWIWFVPWIVMHWRADRPRESLPEGQHPSREPAESTSWTSSWTVSRTTCKERPINGNLSREERQRGPVQFGSGRGKVMIKEVILEGGLTLECKVYDFLNGGLVSQTVAISMRCWYGLWTSCVLDISHPGSEAEPKTTKQKRGCTGRRLEISMGCSHYFRWKDFYFMISQAPGDRQFWAHRKG